MNRATLDQVVTDIASLVEQIIDLERIETESMEGIAKMEAEIKAVEEELTKETLIYNVNYAKNSEELTRRQNVLDVFQFILTFTRCEDATSLLQKKNAVSANLTRICSIKSTGEQTMCFSDKNIHHQFNHVMNKSSRRAISQILAEVQGPKAPSFLQMFQDPTDDQPVTTTENLAIAQSQAAETTPVAGGDELLPKGFVPAP